MYHGKKNFILKLGYTHAWNCLSNDAFETQNIYPSCVSSTNFDRHAEFSFLCPMCKNIDPHLFVNDVCTQFFPVQRDIVLDQLSRLNQSHTVIPNMKKKVLFENRQ